MPPLVPSLLCLTPYPSVEGLPAMRTHIPGTARSCGEYIKAINYM